MTAATSLLDFILNMLKDPQAQAEFRASPEQVLAINGLTGVWRPLCALPAPA